MSHVIETKTNETHHRRSQSATKTQRPAVWRPQASGLTRDELRQIVLETLG